MSSTITGLGSGFDISGWVNQLVAAKQASTVTPLQQKLNELETKNSGLSSLKTKYSTLQSTLQSFTKTIYGSSSDMWNKTSTKSSNDAFATVSSSGSVAAAKVELSIEQIATSTTAKSTASLGAIDKNNIEKTKFTNLANGQATDGTFSLFLNGKEYDIEIDEKDTLADVMDKIKTASGNKIQAEVSNDGKFSIKAYKEEVADNGTSTFVVDESAVLSLGSAGDTSNFADALKLHAKEGNYGFTSSYAISTVNTDIKMTSAESGLSGLKFFDENGDPAKSGKIKINGVEFEVDENTSLNNLISKINNNSDVKVKASYDSLTNKLILTSTETGQSNISLASEGTNLLNVLKLTTGEGEDEIIAAGSQELGQNAIVHINGNKVISSSNTITGESSGIANLSINVKKQTSDYSGNKDDDKSVTIDIEPDYSAIKTSLEKFVNAYNDVVTTTKSMTSATGSIGRDASLNSILSQLKSITSKVVDNDGEFKMLSEIGITSSKTDVSKLTIDSEKLEKALSENLDSVKNLLSDGYMEEADTGIFDGVLENLNTVLDTQKGYFVTQTQSVDSMIKSVNTRIERANNRLATYEARITKQFNQMDTTISNLSNQLSTFMSYMGG